MSEGAGHPQHRKRRTAIPVSPLYRDYFLIGLFANGLPFTLISWGEQRIDSGLAATLARRLPPVSSVAASAICMLLAGVQIVPLALFIEEPWTLAPSATSAWAVFYLGLFPPGWRQSFIST